jgi:hypothetical protein
VLTNKIGDNLIKIRQNAEEALLAAVSHPAFGVKTSLYYLINDVPLPVANGTKSKPKKAVPNTKQLAAKYMILSKMLQSMHFSGDQLDPAQPK